MIRRPWMLNGASDESLLRTYTILTHRLHVADRGSSPQLALDLRDQRDVVRDEILRRMGGE